MVEVVRLDIGDHDHVGIEEEERSVGLVGLADEITAVAVAAVGAVLLDDAADQEGGVAAQMVEHRGDHGARGRLAVRASDRDRRGAGTQSREHLGAGPDGNAQLAGADQLGIGLGNRRRDHDDVGRKLVDRLRTVPDLDVNACVLEAADVIGALEVGAGDPAAALVQDQCDTAHAGTADADEVRARESRRLSHVSPSGLRNSHTHLL